MESTSPTSVGIWQTFLDQHPQLKTQLKLIRSQVQKKPQYVLAGVVGLFLLIGVGATVSLVGVQQDIRQQAAGEIYKGVSIGETCLQVQQSKLGCTTNQDQVVCDGYQWRTTGQKCSQTIQKALEVKPDPTVESTSTSVDICGPHTIDKKVGKVTYNWKASTKTCVTNEWVKKLAR